MSMRGTLFFQYQAQPGSLIQQYCDLVPSFSEALEDLREEGLDSESLYDPLTEHTSSLAQCLASYSLQQLQDLYASHTKTTVDLIKHLEKQKLVTLLVKLLPEFFLDFLKQADPTVHEFLRLFRETEPIMTDLFTPEQEMIKNYLLETAYLFQIEDDQADWVFLPEENWAVLAAGTELEVSRRSGLICRLAAGLLAFTGLMTSDDLQKYVYFLMQNYDKGLLDKKVEIDQALWDQLDIETARELCQPFSFFVLYSNRADALFLEREENTFYCHPDLLDPYGLFIARQNRQKADQYISLSCQNILQQDPPYLPELMRLASTLAELASLPLASVRQILEDYLIVFQSDTFFTTHYSWLLQQLGLTELDHKLLQPLLTQLNSWLLKGNQIDLRSISLILDSSLDDQVKTAALQAAQLKNTNRTGRNDPCPCGSGKKYKKCCGASALANKPLTKLAPARRLFELVPTLGWPLLDPAALPPALVEEDANNTASELNDDFDLDDEPDLDDFFDMLFKKPSSSKSKIDIYLDLDSQSVLLIPILQHAGQAYGISRLLDGDQPVAEAGKNNIFGAFSQFAPTLAMLTFLAKMKRAGFHPSSFVPDTLARRVYDDYDLKEILQQVLAALLEDGTVYLSARVTQVLEDYKTALNNDELEP